MSRPERRSRVLFAILCAICGLTVAAFGIISVRRARPAATIPVVEEALPVPPRPKAEEPPSESPPPAVNSNSSAPSRKAVRHLIYFRNTTPDNYGRLAVAPIDSPDERRYSSDLVCDRVYFAGGRGICLSADRGMFTSYYAISFDDKLRRGWSTTLNGVPSRTRVAPGARLAAITVFLAGHSYVSLDLSTQTTIVEAATGKILADLEQFTVTRDGVEVKSPDFNFWGVTFARDGNRAYASLWSHSKSSLVECDLAQRTAKVIYENVECPSLSPDNTRIAFKKRIIGARVSWRIHVLDLKTMTETALGETRNVDDQVEWLDNQTILYALPRDEKVSSASMDIWSVSAAPDGTPRLFLRDGFSPAVVTEPAAGK